MATERQAWGSGSDRNSSGSEVRRTIWRVFKAQAPLKPLRISGRYFCHAMVAAVGLLGLIELRNESRSKAGMHHGWRDAPPGLWTTDPKQR
jgi:hypothetical protein